MVGKFWSPSGAPPWVSPREPLLKRQCVAASRLPASTSHIFHAPGAVPRPVSLASTNPQSSTASLSFPSYAPGAVPRSAPDMASKAQATHTVLSELLRNINGASTVHAHLGLPWSPPSAVSRTRMPPPQAVVAALRGEASRGTHIGHMLDLVLMVRVAGSV